MTIQKNMINGRRYDIHDRWSGFYLKFSLQVFCRYVADLLLNENHFNLKELECRLPQDLGVSTERAVI